MDEILKPEKVMTEKLTKLERQRARRQQNKLREPSPDLLTAVRRVFLYPKTYDKGPLEKGARRMKEQDPRAFTAKLMRLPRAKVKEVTPEASVPIEEPLPEWLTRKDTQTPRHPSVEPSGPQKSLTPAVEPEKAKPDRRLAGSVWCGLALWGSHRELIFNFLDAENGWVSLWDRFSDATYMLRGNEIQIESEVNYLGTIQGDTITGFLKIVDRPAFKVTREPHLTATSDRISTGRE